MFTVLLAVALAATVRAGQVCGDEYQVLNGRSVHVLRRLASSPQEPSCAVSPLPQRHFTPSSENVIHTSMACVCCVMAYSSLHV